MTTRNCDCSHGFPLCACDELLAGRRLRYRSRLLSAIAGWPGRITPEALAVAESYRRPVAVPVPPPTALAAPGPMQGVSFFPSSSVAAADCGCGNKSSGS